MFFISIEAIREKMDKSTILTDSYKYLKKEMSEIDDSYIDKLVEKISLYDDRAKKFGGAKHFRLGNCLRETAKLCVSLGFVYRISGDENTLFGLKRILKIICGIEKWNCNTMPAGRESDLWVADTGAYAAIAYELIHDKLTDSERSEIKNALLKKAFLPLYDDWINPKTKIHALDTMGHNWWSVCVSGAGIIAMVLKNALPFPDADDVIFEIADGLLKWFLYPGNILQNKKANFGKEGDFIESSAYMDYALSNFSVFEEYFRREYNDNRFINIEFFSKIADFYCNTAQYINNDGFRHFTFGDTALEPRVRDFQDYSPLYLAKVTKNKTIIDICRSIKGVPYSPFAFYFYPDTTENYNETEMSGLKIYNNSGHMILRNESLVFALKSGESWNHNHLDAGTFILSSNGNEFIIDSGTCTYSKKEYSDYYKMPKAHNVILFNDKGQCSDMIFSGTKFSGGFPASISDGSYKYVLCDCTGPYSDIYQRFYRHIIAIDDIIIMIDDIFAYEAGTLSWLLHYEGEIICSDRKTEIHSNNQKITVHNIYPENNEFEIKNGFKPELKLDPDDDGILPPSKYLSFNVKTEDNRRQKFINVFTNREIEVTLSETESVKEIIINNGSKSFRIICNFDADGRVMHFNSIINHKEITTDAFLICMEPGSDKVYIHNGSFLRIEGETCFSSLVKGDYISFLK